MQTLFLATDSKIVFIWHPRALFSIDNMFTVVHYTVIHFLVLDYTEKDYNYSRAAYGGGRP
jgi:hypothetical protein